jgi:hypothetical protein
MTPMFPPAESYAVSPEANTLNQLTKLIKAKVTNPVLLCCPETEEFLTTDDFENEFMGLLSIHPISVDAVKHFVKGNGELKKLNELLENQIIKETDFNGKNYFMMVDAAQVAVSN